MDPAHSKTDVGSETNVEEKAIPAAPVRLLPLRVLSKLWGPAGLVIAGQLILQTLAWTFFGVVWARGIVAIPSMGLPKAIWFKPLSFLFTNISSVLATISTFLFSWGVRQAIVQHLRTEGMSFETFLAGMSISSQQLIKDLKRRKWTALSIIVYVACFEQTSGWNTLLTPQQFVFDDDIWGRDIDLSSSLLQSQFSSGTLDSCVYTSSLRVSLAVGQTQSGFSALNGDLLFPTSNTVLDNDFNTSTGGIFPMAFSEVDSSSWFPETTVFPASLSQPAAASSARGLSWKWSMHQQGFTADVDCQFQDLNAATTPSLFINPDPRTTNLSQTVPTQFSISSNCAAPPGISTSLPLNSSSAYAFAGNGTNGDGYLLMIACNGADSYQLIFVGRGGLYSYLDTTVCTLTPTVTHVQADYSWDGLAQLTTIDTTTFSNGKPDIGGPAANSALQTIYNMMMFSQTISTNVVGDQIKSILENVQDFQADSIHYALEEYLRGVAEYSGSIFRACLSAQNGTFPNGVPSQMTILSTGKLHTEFFGWQFTASSSWILLPGTFVGLATIYIVLRALAMHPGNDRDGGEFKPDDPLDLVAASAAGGLPGVFSGSKKDREEAAKRVHMVLEHAPGYGLGLKHRGRISSV
ncbi:hypothetical protein R3P38DRAFT_3147630 [Favolaschia claudopus]|uniref:Uncharacterized protein n=1 Tax=Favolaschia claudopus TaxID=2862362 RepID=A0AAV9Z317_9AGAR